MDKPETFQNQLVTFILLINEKIMKPMSAMRKGRLTASQFFAVAAVMDCGRMAMSELAERMDISRQQATKTVNQLVENGFMCRIPSGGDRRIIQIDLTDTARCYMAEFVTEFTGALRGRFSALGNAEQVELRAAVEALNRILPLI